jgi:hypothetical protein
MECIIHRSDYPGFVVLGLVQLRWLVAEEAVVHCLLMSQGFLYTLDSLLLPVLIMLPPAT